MDSATTKSTRKRLRGRILTEQGLQKIKTAVLKKYNEHLGAHLYQTIVQDLNKGEYETLTEETLRKILERKQGTEMKKIDALFSLFGLDADENKDYILASAPPDSSTVKALQPTTAISSSFGEDFYYMDRPPLEQTCYDAIVKPGGLIRIRSPKKMGKTLLLEKVVAYARIQGYRTVKLQFGDPQILKLSDADFCKWFCDFVSKQLNLDNKLNEYWTSPIFTTGCTEYFQSYLLSSIESNLVLALDQFEALFQKQELFETLCYLLREWHDYAQPDDNKGKIWQKLRIVMVNSTEKYPQLPVNHSPFNVGIGVDESTGLRGFIEAEAKTLLNHYHLQIKLADSDLKNLVNLVGGHPYLLQQAFAYLKRPDSQSIGELIEKAITEESIFIGYLREILEILENNTNLQEAYKKVIATGRVKLDSESLFKLHSLGLIKLSGNYCVSSCELYRQYFSHCLVDA